MSAPPAFQFYARDFITDEAVRLMSDEQIGVYIKLLCHAWLEDGLPTDENALAVLTHRTPESFAQVWPAIAPKWTEKRGRLVNPRMERERDKQRAWREKSSRGGKNSHKSGDKGGSRVVKAPLKANPKHSHARVAECKEQTANLPTNEVKNGSVAHEVLDRFNEAGGTSFTAKRFLAMIRKRAAEHPELTMDDHDSIIRRNFAAPWWDGSPSPNVIYGSEEQFERAMNQTGIGRVARRNDETARVERWLAIARGEEVA